METQVAETEVRDSVMMADGPEQQKFASRLNLAERRLKSAFLFEKKRRGVHQMELLTAIKATAALRDASVTMLKCLTTDEDREDFAKTMSAHFE
jgi:hypothetical protein